MALLAFQIRALGSNFYHPVALPVPPWYMKQGASIGALPY